MKRTLHFTAEGTRPIAVGIPADAVQLPSKYAEVINEQDSRLTESLVVIDEGTRNKNREFQAKIDDINLRCRTWEAKLRTEVIEAEESINQLKQHCKEMLDSTVDDLERELREKFGHLENIVLPPMVSRRNTMENEVSVFFGQTVPTLMEERTGVVARKLQREYEVFDIESQKEAKRESKLVERASAHLQSTAQRSMTKEQPH